jgi:uncharacterized protein YkwD
VGLHLTARAWILAAAAGIATTLLLLTGSPAPAHAACKGKAAPPETISAHRAEDAVFCLLNRERAKRELPRLGRHKQLDGPAREHSRYMVDHGCFEHDCPGEPDLADRLRRYLSKGGRTWGENIASGGGEAGSPRSIVRSWMGSKGHRANILSSQYEHIGIGVVWGSPQDWDFPAGTYTTDFGARGG